MSACTAPDHVLGFVLTVVAGLATVLGAAAIPLLKYKAGGERRLTAGALGFAAGVMLYVSFVDVLGEEAKQFFEDHFTKAGAGCSRRRLGEEEPEIIMVRVWVAVFFFVGIALAIGIDFLADRVQGKHAHDHFGAGKSASGGEAKSTDTQPDQVEAGTACRPATEDGADAKHAEHTASLERVSIVTFLALTLHNFPEGLATFFSGGTGSYTVPFAIAMHNIPEGAAIAIPMYQASGSVMKVLKATFIAGLAQPIGAGVGWILLQVLSLEEVPSFLYGAMYSMTAGIMVCVSLMELIPAALENASAFFVCCWIFAGFLLMECSIVVLGIVGA